MGFNVELLILYRRAVPETGHGIWEAHEAITFGRVTRLEKITHPRFAHLQKDHHERAGICVVSVLLGRMFAKLDTTPREAFAPPFLISELPDGATFAEGLEAYQGALRGAADDLLLRPFPLEQRSIDAQQIKLHNDIVSLDDDALRWSLNDYHPVMDPPFLWERCSALADWLETAEVQMASEWQELMKDPISLALARAWRAYLREVGAVGARALFIFPRW